MADNAEVLQQIKRQGGISYSALTPNLQGFHAAVRIKHCQACCVPVVYTYRLMLM